MDLFSVVANLDSIILSVNSVLASKNFKPV